MGASRVGDVAHAGARRMGRYGAAALLITLALAFLLVAADVLSTRMHGWAAALIVAGFTLVMGGVCAWSASATPLLGEPLIPQITERGERL